MCSSLEKALCYRSTIITTAQFTESVRGGVKATGPLSDGPNEAGGMCDNAKWSFHYAGAVTPTTTTTQEELQSKGAQGPLAASSGGRSRAHRTVQASVRTHAGRSVVEYQPVFLTSMQNAPLLYCT